MILTALVSNDTSRPSAQRVGKDVRGQGQKVDPKLREVGILVNGRQEMDSQNKGTNVFVQVQVVLDTSICRAAVRE